MPILHETIQKTESTKAESQLDNNNIGKQANLKGKILCENGLHIDELGQRILFPKRRKLTLNLTGAKRGRGGARRGDARRATTIFSQRVSAGSLTRTPVSGSYQLTNNTTVITRLI